jgi:hypothetical protein
VRKLVRWWVRGLVDPVAVMGTLPGADWSKAGMLVMVTRFTVQDLVQALPSALLSGRPFIPAKLPIRSEHNYRAQLVLSPGVRDGQWLLLGGTEHGLLRRAWSGSGFSWPAPP